MRIVGGRHRGRRIVVPAGRAIRPTSDRARQALFDILDHDKSGSLVHDAEVLDAFAGSGALGLEALSRGARRASFIENDRVALDHIRRNVEALGEAEKADIRAGDALKPSRPTAAANLAFLDPPYGKDMAAPALAALARAGWLAPGARVVVELHHRDRLEPPQGFALVDERRYGVARLVFLDYVGDPSPSRRSKR